MLQLRILAVGTLKEPFWHDAMAEYEKRIGGYARLAVREVRTDRELLPILAQSPRACKIALCVEGSLLSSEALAERLGSLSVRGVSEVIFVIGGADGMGEDVKAACDFRLSFSPMTFPHTMMRVILAEQLYRALTILHNGRYHK